MNDINIHRGNSKIDIGNMLAGCITFSEENINEEIERINNLVKSMNRDNIIDELLEEI